MGGSCVGTEGLLPLRRRGRLALVLLTALALALSAATQARPAEGADLAEVILVGNNWEGTADIIEVRYPNQAGAGQAKKCLTKKAGEGKRKTCKRSRGAEFAQAGQPGQASQQGSPSYRTVARINIVPDLQERMAELLTNPIDLAYFLAIRVLIGENNDQFVDDMYTTNDGRLLIVSRPSLKDVVGIELATGEIAWRFEVAGQRADHMGLSPDGTRVAVSASTGNVVHILDTETGQEVGRFPSGDSPHENSYSADGQRIFHASIGLVYTPLDLPLLDSTKGDRRFQVVDTATNGIIKRVNIGQKLAEAGYPDMSSAVRPMAITADESRIYMQVSFLHGFVEYDNVNDRVLRVANLPDHYGGPRETYLLDSAHHGIAIDGSDQSLCVAGTMSDYAAIVDVDDFSDRTLLQGLGTKPYWSTTSRDGRYCYVSWSGTDAISVIDYATRQEVAHIPVGDHPQRVRTGQVPQSFIDAAR